MISLCQSIYLSRFPLLPLDGLKVSTSGLGQAVALLTTPGLVGNGHLDQACDQKRFEVIVDKVPSVTQTGGLLQGNPHQLLVGCLKGG